MPPAPTALGAGRGAATPGVVTFIFTVAVGNPPPPAKGEVAAPVSTRGAAPGIAGAAGRGAIGADGATGAPGAPGGRGAGGAAGRGAVGAGRPTEGGVTCTDGGGMGAGGNTTGAVLDLGAGGGNGADGNWIGAVAFLGAAETGVTGEVASRTCVTPAAGLARNVIRTVSFFSGTALVFEVDGGGIGEGVSSLMETGMMKLNLIDLTALKSSAHSASILFSQNHRLIGGIFALQSKSAPRRYDTVRCSFRELLKAITPFWP